MPITVEIEGKGVVAEFPDGTDPTLIDSVIKRDFFSQQPAPQQSSEVQPEQQDVIGMMHGGDSVVSGDWIGPRKMVGGIAHHAPEAGMVAGALATRGSPWGGPLGYMIGKQAQPLMKSYAEETPLPSGTSMAQKAMGPDLLEAEIGMVGGPAAAKVAAKTAQLVAKGLGKVAKQTLGSLTGTGTGAIEEALKGSPKFRAALRNKISSDEIVENARNVLGSLKQQRGAAYQKDLANLATNQGSINIDPLKQETSKLLKQYVRVDKATGEADWTRSALGSKDSEGVNKIRNIVETIQEWGSKEGDDTVLGLDMLKRQLDDFYSDSSNARAFVTTIRNKVKDLLVENAPNYANMTKGYSEATKLIKDVESGLMMRKQGISGRIIADQTLRRLTSAMRDNFELRRELVNVLGSQGGQDIAGEVAGHAMSQVIPRGLTGSGLAVGGGMMASYINPQLLPILIASSPRVSGEFLMMFGKGLKETPGMTEAGAKFLSYLAADKSNKE